MGMNFIQKIVTIITQKGGRNTTRQDLFCLFFLFFLFSAFVWFGGSLRLYMIFFKQIFWTTYNGFFSINKRVLLWASITMEDSCVLKISFEVDIDNNTYFLHGKLHQVNKIIYTVKRRRLIKLLITFSKCM